MSGQPERRTMRRTFTITIVALATMALTVPVLAGGNHDEEPFPLEISTFCDADNLSLSHLKVANLSDETVQVYAYPLDSAEGAEEQTIEPGGFYLVTGEGAYVVYLLIDGDWELVAEGLMAVCEDPEEEPPCFECGATTSTTIPVETTTTVVEETTTTEAAVVTTTAPKPPTTVAAVTLPFTGANVPFLLLAGLSLLALGGLLVRSVTDR